MVPDASAVSLLMKNSWSSAEMSLTYIASGPSQPPIFTVEAELEVLVSMFSPMLIDLSGTSLLIVSITSKEETGDGWL